MKYMFNTIFILILQKFYKCQTEFTKCDKKKLEFPLIIDFPLEYADFAVNWKFNIINEPYVRKTIEGYLQIDNEFGSFFYNSIEYNINTMTIKSPSEHSLGDLTYALEVQIEGRTAMGGTAVLIHFGEENSQLYNKELLKMGVGNEIFRNIKEMTSTKMKEVKQDFNEIFKNNNKYMIYSGQSTNRSCPYSLIIINTNTFWISHEQLLDFGNKNLPDFLPKKKPEDTRVFQNFIKLEIDSVYESVFKERKKTESENNAMDYNWPVPLPYTEIMYHVPNSKTALGTIPSNAIPYWHPMPKANCILKVKSYPKIVEPYKFQLYFYEEVSNDVDKEHTDSKFRKCIYIYRPRYIIVDEYFSPKSTVRPSKIPISIRTQLAYPNKNRPVIHLRMPTLFDDPDDDYKEMNSEASQSQFNYDGNDNNGSTGNPLETIATQFKNKLERNECSHYELNIQLNLDIQDEELMENMDNHRPMTKCLRKYTSKTRVINNSKNVGQWGGYCKCADGIYPAGDESGNCMALACIGGVPSSCFQKAGPWSGKKIYCAQSEKVILENILDNTSLQNVKNIKKYCETILYVVLNRKGALNYDDYVAHYCGNDTIKSYTGSVLTEQEHLVPEKGNKNFLGEISNLFKLKNKFEKNKNKKNSEEESQEDIDEQRAGMFMNMKLQSKKMEGNVYQKPQ